MLDLFTHQALAACGLGWQFAKLLATALPTPDVADLAAYTFLEDAGLKQSLLAEPDVARRVGRVVEALEAACVATPQAPPASPPQSPPFALASHAPGGSPGRFRNPSLN